MKYYKNIQRIEILNYSRNCYRDVESENLLKFFKIYSEDNCIHEHLSEFINESCGCVPYFMISKIYQSYLETIVVL